MGNSTRLAYRVRRPKMVVSGLLVAAALLGAGRAVADEPGAGDRASACDGVTAALAAIRTAGPDAAPGPSPSERELIEHWAEVIAEAQREFRTLVRAQPREQRREGLQCLAADFGRHGPQADFRWAVASAEMSPMGTAAVPYAGDTDESRFWREAQLGLAEAMVREFLRRPEALDRYYRVVLWRGGLFGNERAFPIRLESTTRGLLGENAAAEEYWWHALHGLLFVHATGQDRLLKDADPERLGEVFRRWSDWMRENGPYLRADAKTFRWAVDERDKADGSGYVGWFRRQNLRPPSKPPEAPLPDWEGTPPPPPRLLLEF